MAKQVWTATGRRKRSVAQVRLTAGKGNITVNGKDVNEYMPFAVLVMDLKQPLVATPGFPGLAGWGTWLRGWYLKGALLQGPHPQERGRGTQCPALCSF